MMWGVLGAVTMGVLVWVMCLYRRDRRRERARVREVLSPTVAAEIATEREAAVQRKERFEAALRRAKEELRE